MIHPRRPDVAPMPAPRPLPAFVDLPVLTGAQERILAYTRASPGLTIRDMAKAIGVSHATMTHHLGLLVRKGMLARDRDGREVRHYPVGTERRKLTIEALCRDPRKRMVYEFLASEPDAMSINRMAQKLQLPFGYLKRTLEQFEKQGLVTLHRARFRYMVAAGVPLSTMASVQEATKPALDGIALLS